MKHTSYHRWALCVATTIGLLLLMMSTPLLALEYQWRFYLPVLQDKEAAEPVMAVMKTIPAASDLFINQQRGSLDFFLDHEQMDEETVKARLQQAHFPVERIILMHEPRTR